MSPLPDYDEQCSPWGMTLPESQNEAMMAQGFALILPDYLGAGKELSARKSAL
jgi:hypothetical protein